MSPLPPSSHRVPSRRLPWLAAAGSGGPGPGADPAAPSPTRGRRPGSTAGIGVGAAATLLLALVVTACGAGDPSPSPEQTSSPTIGPETRPEEGTFLFPGGQVIAAYESLGFVCDPAAPSGRREGYTFQQCRAAQEDLVVFVALSVDEAGATGQALMGVVTTTPIEVPTIEEALRPMARFMGAMLGEAVGTEAYDWLVTQIGAEDARTEVNGVAMSTYVVRRETGAGYFVEFAAPAYLAAPERTPDPTASPAPSPSEDPAESLAPSPTPTP